MIDSATKSLSPSMIRTSFLHCGFNLLGHTCQFKYKSLMNSRLRDILQFPLDWDLENQFTFRLSLYPYSNLFDPEDFEQPYSEEPELTSRDFIYKSWSDSMDSAIDNAMETESNESQEAAPVEFNWEEFFDSVINPVDNSPDHEIIFSNEDSFFLFDFIICI